MNELYQKYLKTLDGWMAYYKFKSLTFHSELGIDRVFKKSGFQSTKFGKVDTFVIVKFFGNQNVESLKTYSDSMFSFALRARSGGAPLGFGAMMVVYPLIVLENITQEQFTFINNYCPKHFAAAEFPSIIDLKTGSLYYYPSTPLWGALYYSGYRSESYNLFSPKSWNEISKNINQNNNK
jgi:hypothetical protein